MPTDIHHHAEQTSSGPRVSATRARQGRFGRHIFWILIVSTVLAAASASATSRSRQANASSMVSERLMAQASARKAAT